MLTGASQGWCLSPDTLPYKDSPHALPGMSLHITSHWAGQVCGLKHTDPHVSLPATPGQDAGHIAAPQQDKKAWTHMQR